MPKVWKKYDVRSADYCVGKGGKKSGKLKKGWRWKNGKCVKRRSNRNCKRSKATYDGIKISLPCRAKSLTPAMKSKIDKQVYGKMSSAKWNSAADRGCRIVFFKANPVMRCPGKSLKAQYRARKRQGRVSKKFLRNIRK